MSSQTTNYIPGVCNINREEIAYRKKAAYAGLAVSVIYLVCISLIDASIYLRLLVFFPAFVATIGFLQARNKFCVAYGASGKQNADDGGTTKSVATAAATKDKQRARSMNLQAVAIAAIFSLAFYLLPY